MIDKEIPLAVESNLFIKHRINARRMRNLLNVLYCQLNRIFYCERAEMGEYKKLKQVNFTFSITISGFHRVLQWISSRKSNSLKEGQ